MSKVLKFATKALLLGFAIMLIVPTNIKAAQTYSINGSNFKKVGIEEGLSSAYITTLFQDEKGYMWIGTSDGLNRYDGNKVKVYNCNSNDENSLSSTYITALAEDVNGDLWIGTDSGLDILYRKNNTIYRTTEELENKYTLPSKITSIYRDSNDTMWVGTEKGLFGYNVNAEEGKYYYADSSNDYALTHSSVTSIEEDENGYLWVGTKFGINAIDLKTGKIHNSSNEIEEKLFVYDVKSDKQGYMWIATKNGVYKCKDNTSILEYIEIDIGEKLLTNIDKIMLDRKDNIWFTSSNGIIKYSVKAETSELIKSQTLNKNSMSSNFISCYYEDMNGIIWIGTENGLNILSESNYFTSLVSTPYPDKNLNGFNITSIFEDESGYTWIGYNNNGIDVLDKDNNVVRSYTHDPDNSNSIASNKIKCITSSMSGEMVIYTNNGYSQINTSTGKIKSFIVDNNYISEVFYAHSDGKYFWTASNSRFASYNIQTKEVKYYSDHLEENNIDSGSIRYIYQDPNDSDILWLGGNNTGLIKFHKTKGILKKYLSDKNDSSSIIHNTINSIIFDSLDNIWIGTSIGLSKFDLSTEKFISYTVADGLSNNFISSILIDEENNPWISTNNGLNKFNIKNNKFINFTEMDGIQGMQFNRSSRHKYNDGTMVFGSTDGVTFFDPKDIIEPAVTNNKVVIGDISINNQYIPYNGQALVTEHNSNSIVVDFFLPDYKNENNVTYEYMLEGIDSKWVFGGSRNYVNYKSLSPGDYTFKVRARDGQGNLSEETEFQIKVNDPLWRSPFAYLFYLILIIGLVIYSINYVKILQNLVNQKTRKLNNELEKNQKLSLELINHEKFKNNYFVNLSHELRTPIHVIFSTVQLINLLNAKGDVEQKKSQKYMKIITKNCNHLLTIINDIIDSSKIETGQYKINKENNDIVYLVEEAVLNMSQFIEEKNITLIIDPDIEEKVISCDKEEIERCVINLLGNATKFTPEGGQVSVYIKEANGYIHITVEDTGIGISEEDQQFIFNRFSQASNNGATKASSSGIGLTLVKHVIELHGGTIRLESELNKGSRFTISLPDVKE